MQAKGQMKCEERIEKLEASWTADASGKVLDIFVNRRIAPCGKVALPRIANDPDTGTLEVKMLCEEHKLQNDLLREVLDMGEMMHSAGIDFETVAKSLRKTYRERWTKVFKESIVDFL